MFTLPKLSYEFSALEPYIDTQTMEIHYGKHHQAYVDNLNKLLEGNEDLLKMPILDLVQNLDKVPEEIRTKVRNNAGGHVNHSFFWKLMSPSAQSMPTGKILDLINSSFGDFDSFKEKFSTAALGRFGSGWVWLLIKNGKLEIADTPNQDTPLMDGNKAILGLDVWEHAYYILYKWQRAEYIKNWWNIVNWQKVEENYHQASANFEQK